MRLGKRWVVWVALVCGVGIRSAGAQCSVTATSINFRTYDVFSTSPVTAVGTITVDCNMAPPPDVVIQIGPSANSGSFNPRQMKPMAGPDRLNYNLFTDASMTIVWGDGTSGTATKTCEQVVKPKPCTQMVYALLPAGQDVAVGVYQDIVTVTILVVPKR
ncbi:MAG: spore coat U domain-containing protein [Acidobacteria bacterium]|nr:spore coat U domain-containing protein [Acidobacteriota bacterium]MDW7983414.1 spore coat U domain-containing protein [Acidobacteriota bacterium]